MSACVTGRSNLRGGVAAPSALLLAVVFASSGLGGCGASKRQVDEQSAGTGGSAGAAATGGAGAPPSAAGAPTNDAGAPPLADNQFPCENPTPVISDATGFVTCENGYTYRERPGTCPIMRRAEPVPGGGPDAECVYDADCADDPQGYCRTGYCATGCLDDSECGEYGVCACSSEYGLGTCILAKCVSDADCLPGLHCALIIDGASDSATWTYACQREEDECVSDDDCPPRRDTETGNCELADEGRYCE